MVSLFKVSAGAAKEREVPGYKRLERHYASNVIFVRMIFPEGRFAVFRIIREENWT